MIALRECGKFGRPMMAFFVLSLLACASEVSPTRPPPARSGPRLFLEIGPGGAVYQQDSTHCVVAEGWEVYWRVRRNVTEGEAGFRVRTQAGTASGGSDFDADDITLRFSPGQAEFWSYERGCPVGTTVRDDTIPEPDEQFTLVLESTTPGVLVDPIRSTITVTIVDNDDPRVSDRSFYWPLDQGRSWSYWNLRRSTVFDYDYLQCSSGTSETQVTGETAHGDRSYHMIGPSNGYGSVAVAMDGSRAWIIPPFAPVFPPQASDTIAVHVWETYPRLFFDGSQPELPCASGFAERAQGYSWDLSITAWHDRARCDGLSVVATPAGVFRHVIRATYAADWTEPSYVGWADNGVEITYFVADSVGVVARTESSNRRSPAGHNAGSSVSTLIRTTGGPPPGGR